MVIGLNGAFKSVNYEIMSINAEMQSYFKESLQGIEVVKANNLVEQIKTKFMQKYLMYTNCIYKGNMLGVISGSASLLIEQISNIVIIFGGFILIDAGTIMLGDLLSFYMILSCLINPVKDILSLQPTFQSGIIALDRIEDIQYMEEDQNKGLDEITDIWKIQFDNVCFHYPGKDELLKNISFTVEGDKKIAIIGKNGTGKSTLLKLILGFEKVDSGNLSINGINIQKINIQDVRDKISYVVQNNFLFADTIYNNVTFENDNYSINDIQKTVNFRI